MFSTASEVCLPRKCCSMDERNNTRIRYSKDGPWPISFWWCWAYCGELFLNYLLLSFLDQTERVVSHLFVTSNLSSNRISFCYDFFVTYSRGNIKSLIDYLHMFNGASFILLKQHHFQMDDGVIHVYASEDCKRCDFILVGICSFMLRFFWFCEAVIKSVVHCKALLISSSYLYTIF